MNYRVAPLREVGKLAARMGQAIPDVLMTNPELSASFEEEFARGGARALASLEYAINLERDKMAARQMKESEANAATFKGKPAKVQVFKTGRWEHRQYGTIDIKPEHLDQMVSNFENTGRACPLDFDHGIDVGKSPVERKAAGWFRGLKVERMPDGSAKLWGDVALTDQAAEWVKEGSYRYFSPTWVEHYLDKVTGVDRGHALYGGGLTNTPYIDAMAPVQLMNKQADRSGEPFTYDAVHGGVRAGVVTLMEKPGEPRLSADVVEAFAMIEDTPDTMRAVDRALSEAHAMGGVRCLVEVLNGDTILRDLVLNDRGSTAHLKPSERLEIAAVRVLLAHDERLGAKRLSKYEAYARVLSGDPQLARDYREETVAGAPKSKHLTDVLAARARDRDVPQATEAQPDAVKELIERAAVKKASDSKLTDHAAMSMALNEDPDLAERYRAATVRGLSR